MLKGERVLLRSVERRDVNIFYEMWGDEDLRDLDGGYLVAPSKEYVLENFNKYMNLNKKYLSIVNEKGVVVGYITYEAAKDFQCIYTIGITIAKDFCSRGYGTDSINTLLKFLFMNKGANRVELEVVDINHRAIGCYKKCGFKQEGIKRKRYFTKGKFRDLIIMGIIKEEYLNKYDSVGDKY